MYIDRAPDNRADNDNSKIFFLISQGKRDVTPHYNRLSEKVIMMGRNISFKEIIWKIIPKLSLLPLLT